MGSKDNNLKKECCFEHLMQFSIFRHLFALIQKYRSEVLYIIFGGLTTIISIATFVLFHVAFSMNELVANVLSWIFAVLFAYVTNRLWVFCSKAKGVHILKELLLFFGGRTSTLLIEELLLFIFVSVLDMNGTMIKLLSQFIVLVLNYVISKLFVFGGKEE